MSPSMQPTLQGTSYVNGDHVLSEKLSFYWRRPRRWEVIAFRNEEGITVMKRVVGLPGETIHMNQRGELFVDGALVPQPAYLSHVRYVPIAFLFQERKFHCQDGYFVLGDDSRDSDDSRYNGEVPSDGIIGRAWLIVHPWRRFGFVR